MISFQMAQLLFDQTRFEVDESWQSVRLLSSCFMMTSGRICIGKSIFLKHLGLGNIIGIL
jgi:hypothetical protein